jgi:mannosyl-3-phosphoglycerate phosphatase
MTSSEDRLLVITDLDGTLLDHTTYAFAAARPALDALDARAVPLVIATSKTRPEVEEVAAAIGGHPILIVENGGAVLMPAVHALHADAACGREDTVIELGVARSGLVRQLAEIAAETGARIRGFAQLSIAEIGRLTGLPPQGARLARERQYDEPFLLEYEMSATSAPIRLSPGLMSSDLNFTSSPNLLRVSGGTMSVSLSTGRIR